MKYEMNIRTKDQGTYTLTCEGRAWEVSHDDEGRILRHVDAETVAGFLVGRLDGIRGKLIYQLSHMLRSIEVMTAEDTPF